MKSFSSAGARGGKRFSGSVAKGRAGTRKSWKRVSGSSTQGGRTGSVSFGKAGKNGGPRPPRPGLNPAVRSALSKLLTRIGDAQVRWTLSRLLDGLFLSRSQVTLVRQYLNGSACPLTDAERDCVSECLADGVEDSVEDAGTDTDTAAVAEAKSYRYLEVTNNTGRKLTVYLQYKAPAGDAFVWQPADPAQSDESLAFDLEPGETISPLGDDDQAVAACRVRLWAAAGDGSVWGDYQDTDLWLVPERDSEGYHSYRAAEVETFTFAFNR
jgi:hypothetical protein